MKNQEQIGPISREHLTAAAREGRLLPSDAVWTQNMPQWQAAGTVPGLFSTAYAPTAYVPSPESNYYPAAPDPADPILRMALPIGRSWWAIAAGYFGLFSFLVLPAPVSLVLSLIALQDIRKNPGKLGKGRAIFGLVMGVLGTLLLVWILIMVAMRS